MVKQDSLISAEDVNRELYAKNAELAVRNKTLALLHRMADVAVRSLGTQEMVEEIVSILDDEFTYPFVSMGLLDDRKKMIEWRAFSTSRENRPFFTSLKKNPSIFLDAENNACVQAMHSGRRHVVSSLHEIFPHISVKDAQELQDDVGMKSTLVLPLTLEKESMGVLLIGLDRPPQALTSYERQIFPPFIGLVTVALQKAEAHGKLKHTTHQLRVANRELRQVDAMKSEFLSIASHQLRTPLAVMKGYIGMLTGGMLGDLQPPQLATLKKMQGATEQLIALVNHLLDVSRIESNRLQVRLEPVDLCKVMGEVVGFIQGKADERHLNLAYTPSSDACTVSVDAEKIKEIFMNLLDNALKYTDNGGVKVDIQKKDTQVEVSIVDTGHGLTKQDMDNLFKKFVTGSASKKVSTTTGLGLYVCKKLTEAMGGTIVAQSEGHDKGSTFTVSFPLT